MSNLGSRQYGFVVRVADIAGWRYGFVSSRATLYGESYVLHNSKKDGRIVEEQMSVFSNGNSVYYYSIPLPQGDDPPSCNITPKEAVNTAYKLLGKKSNVFKNGESIINNLYKVNGTLPSLGVVIIGVIEGIKTV